ncbi:hypothetical protein COU57_01120 [Candidatus Pacearchaeota archaeon CG10_big_fil_rev_8_21_14_0_10_32_14]|nr:MAG: hypothetical protein COU57_01120 [Candidatus Pacearchaeota archaeon CG10_big_fil_rev_8_21_14_0_10_32_14]
MVTKEALEKSTLAISKSYFTFITELGKIGQFINLLILVLLSVLFCIFVWKLSKYLSKKDMFELNLDKHNSSDHAFYSHLISAGFFILEYIIIYSLFLFSCVIIFSILLVMISPASSIVGILSISTIIIVSIRITSYFREDLSKDISKFLPFSSLAVSFFNPSFFEVSKTILRFNDSQIFINNLFFFLAFIFIIEAIMRIFDFIMSLFVPER